MLKIELHRKFSNKASLLDEILIKIFDVSYSLYIIHKKTERQDVISAYILYYTEEF